MVTYNCRNGFYAFRERFMSISRFCMSFIAGVLALDAQETRGTILGRVTDASGAVVAGASGWRY